MQPLRETHACGVPAFNEADERWLHLMLQPAFGPRLLLHCQSVHLMWRH